MGKITLRNCTLAVLASGDAMPEMDGYAFAIKAGAPTPQQAMRRLLELAAQDEIDIEQLFAMLADYCELEGEGDCHLALLYNVSG